MILILLPAVGLLSLALLLATLYRKLGPQPGSLPLTTEWIDEVSAERYLPMLRLLQEDDFKFFRSEPGFTSSMETSLRKQRSDIVRGYLRSLSADFGRVCATLRVLMVQSEEDRPDLASVLLHQQAMFACGLMAFIAASCSIATA